MKGIYAWTGVVTPTKLTQYKANGYIGVRLICRWTDYQTSAGDLSLTAWKAAIKMICDAGLECEVHWWTGPDSPISGSNHWLADLGVRTFTTTGGADNGPWPDYYSSIYQQYWNALHNASALALRNLADTYPSVMHYFKSVFVSSASTGDLQPWKGKPVGGTFNIADDATWQAFYQSQWLTAYNYYAANTDFMRTTYNIGEAAKNIHFILTSLPGSYMKEGDRSHEYPLNGESYMLNWPDGVYLGEVDDEIKNSTNKSDKFQLIMSALSVKTSRLDFFDDWLSLSETPGYVAIFNKYVTQYNPVTANKGFCVLHEKVNFTNDHDYSVAAFGQLYDNTNVFNGIINQINSSSDDTLRKQMRTVSAAQNRKNPGRLNNLKNTGAGYAPAGSYYNNDIAWSCVNNFSLNLTQLLIQETTTPYYRVDAGSIYGRSARAAKLYQGFTALYFRVDDRLIVSAENDSVTFTVTYKDEGTTTWEIQCYKCLSLSITNTNTGTWKQVSLTADHFKKGGLMRNSADLIIETKKGTSPKIHMIEVANSSK